MRCPYKNPCCDTKSDTETDGIQCTHDCVCDMLKRIDRLERALKPVLECKISDNGGWREAWTSLDAVRDSQRIYTEGGAR